MGGTALDLYNEQKQLAEIRSSIAHYLSTWGSQEAQVIEAWADVLSPRPNEPPAAAPVGRTPSLTKQTEAKTRAAKAAEEKNKKPLRLEIDPLAKASAEQKSTLPRASPMLSPPVRSLHQSPQVPKARPPNGSPTYHRRSSLQGAEFVSTTAATSKSPVADGLPRMSGAGAVAQKRPESSPPQVHAPSQGKSPSPHLSRSTSSESMERFLETCHESDDDDDDDQEAVREKKSIESLSSTANELLLESRELSGSMKSGNLFVMRRRRQSASSSKPVVTPTHSTGSTSASRGRPPVAPQTPTSAALSQGYTSPGVAPLPPRLSGGGPPPRPPKEDVETPKRSTPSHSEEHTPTLGDRDCTGIFSNTPFQTPDGKLLQRSTTATPKRSAQKGLPPHGDKDMDSSCCSSSSAGSYV